MYLSCLLIDTGENPDRPRPGRLWLRNIYRVHQRLCMAFPSAALKGNDPQFLTPFHPDGFQHVHGTRTEEQAFLFRIEPVPGGSAVIVVQSGRKPDWEYAFHNADHLLAAPPDMKPFDPPVTNGRSLRFRLVANPTKRLSENSTGPDGNPVKNDSVGKRVPVSTEKTNEWLEGRAGPAGFHVERLINVQMGYVYMSKDTESRASRLRSARYDGILQVTDPALFRHTLMRGIGPGKAFGFGLLSIALVGGKDNANVA